VTTPGFALTVFPLGHQDIDGLVGMNFLRHFNFDVRPAGRPTDPRRADQTMNGAAGAGRGAVVARDQDGVAAEVLEDV